MDFTAVHPLVWMGIAFLATIMLVKSFKIPRADQGIERYLVGEHRTTILPRGFVENLEKADQEKCKKLGIRTTPLDIVFGLWPFYSLVRFSTSPTTITLYATELFTKKFDIHPRVRLSAKPSLGIRFLTIRNTILGTGFSNLDNLTHEDDITGEGPAGEGPGKEPLKYRDTYLAKGLREKAKDPIRDGLRKAATNFFFHSGEDTGKTKDEFEINTSKKLWEKTALFEMAAPESVFGQSHILKRPDSIKDLEPDTHPKEFWKELRKLKIKDFFGADILSMDTTIPKMDLSRIEEGASDAQKVVNDRYVAIQKGAARITEGKAEASATRSNGFAVAESSERQGQADAVSAAAIQEKLQGTDPAIIAALQLLKDKNVTMVPVGGNIPEIIRNIVGGGK